MTACRLLDISTYLDVLGYAYVVLVSLVVSLASLFKVCLL